jgi:Ca-activated chloride channel family protein
MFHFADPWFLLLGLLGLPLLWWSLRQRRNALRHPSLTLAAGLPPGRSGVSRWGGAVLRALAMVCLAVALAGPRWPDLKTRIETEGIAIVMVVDVSGSMAEPDFEWNGEPMSRLGAVKRAFRLFVEGGAGADSGADGAEPRPGPRGSGAPAGGPAATTTVAFEGRPTDLIGLVTFGTRPDSLCPLTLSHSVVLRLLDAEQPRSVPGESETNISDAVALGLHRLKAAGPRRKVLVLLTDGEHNVPRPPSGWTPRQAAQVAVSLDIPIYTIDAGTGSGTVQEPGGVPPPGDPERSPGFIRAQAVQTLQELAHISHGRYFQARDTAGLLNACQAIDDLERESIQSFQYRRYHEGYPWFGLASFVLFFTAMALEMTVWRRLP